MKTEREKMAEAQKNFMYELSVKIDNLESQKRKVENNPEKYYGENPWDDLRRLKKEYKDAEDRYKYWTSNK